MTSSEGAPFVLPPLPGGHTVAVAGRGEMFVRRHTHADPLAPTVLLLHGWTASADLQFLNAYDAVAALASFVAIDHRGHGRGLRTDGAFELEDAADDAAAVIEQLGIGPVVCIGYSMGGPISMLLARRHPHLVSALVVQATALEWREKVSERLRWRVVWMFGSFMRHVGYPRWLRLGLKRLISPDHPMHAYLPWILGELRRNDPWAIVQAGRALSRYDAREWAGSLGCPAVSVVTTADRLVPPQKQRALARALDASVVELAGDHLAALVQPAEFADATRVALERVLSRVPDAR